MILLKAQKASNIHVKGSGECIFSPGPKRECIVHTIQVSSSVKKRAVSERRPRAGSEGLVGFVLH